MTVRELITELLQYDMNANVVIQKELDYNIWVNSEVKIQKERNDVVLSFDFPIENFEIKRKQGLTKVNFYDIIKLQKRKRGNKNVQN